MNKQVKQQIKELFLKAWNNPSIATKDLHTYLTSEAHKAGFLSPDVELTEDATRNSYATLGEDYKDYRGRPRKVKPSDMIIDFNDSDPNETQEEDEQPIRINPEPELEEVEEEEEEFEEELEPTTKW